MERIRCMRCGLQLSKEQAILDARWVGSWILLQAVRSTELRLPKYKICHHPFKNLKWKANHTPTFQMQHWCPSSYHCAVLCLVAQSCPIFGDHSRQENWSKLPCPPPGNLLNLGIEPRSPTLQADSLPAMLPGKPKNTGVESLSFLQEIFPTQESNWGLLHCKWILYQLSCQGSPHTTVSEINYISQIFIQGLQASTAFKVLTTKENIIKMCYLLRESQLRKKTFKDSYKTILNLGLLLQKNLLALLQ